MAHSDGLERMKCLLGRLDNPEKELKVFHIAGTNGKGSTGVMIASILEKAGYRVGVYTSPHLIRYYERIQLWDGGHHEIPEEKYEELGKQVDKAAAEIAGLKDKESGEEYGELHVFERLTTIAYLWFAEERPDYVVLECGLGGRLDSTNTIERPLACVITQVGLDHTGLLGNTVIKVAREKAGIICEGVPVVSQSPDSLVRNIFIREAREKGCDFYDASLAVPQIKGMKLGMKGEHQYANAATAVCAIQASGVEVSDEAVEQGLAEAVIQGRFEIINADNGTVWVLDGAHNPDATEALVETYNSWCRTEKIKRSLVIFGCMKDKNYRQMIKTLAGRLKGCHYATVSVDDERAEDSELLGRIMTECGKNVSCCESVQEAYEFAKSSNYEAVLVTGSIYLAGEMKKLLQADKRERKSPCLTETEMTTAITIR